MWDSSHTHTHHTINQIGASKSLPLKSLTSSLGPTLWGSVFEPTRGYRPGSDRKCRPHTRGHVYRFLVIRVATDVHVLDLTNTNEQFLVCSS